MITGEVGSKLRAMEWRRDEVKGMLATVMRAINVVAAEGADIKLTLHFEVGPVVDVTLMAEEVLPALRRRAMAIQGDITAIEADIRAEQVA